MVYHEIDSVIPTVAPYEFLKKKPEDTTARLKTIRLKGKISQGLVLPISLFEREPKIPQENETILEVKEMLESAEELEPARYLFKKIVNEGDDLTEWLGIEKYEPPIPAQLRGLVKGQFPFFLTKTDETRIQSCPSVLERNKNKKVFITEKVDGSSFTAYFYTREQAVAYGLPIKEDEQEVFGVCSRNLDLEQTEDNSFWKCALKFDMRNQMRELGRPLAIQGELYGDGIQYNKLKQPGLNFALFNVYDLATKKYCGFYEFLEVGRNLKLKPVPCLAFDTDLNYTVEQLVVMSIGKSMINPAVWREGIVIRTMEEDVDRDLGRFSFKVINPEFLIEYKE